MGDINRLVCAHIALGWSGVVLSLRYGMRGGEYLYISAREKAFFALSLALLVWDGK